MDGSDHNRPQPQRNPNEPTQHHWRTVMLRLTGRSSACWSIAAKPTSGPSAGRSAGLTMRDVLVSGVHEVLHAVQQFQRLLQIYLRDRGIALPLRRR
ncbi:hypothetical protein FHU35_15565 [Saccharopolyspora dendranthemae]|uniref:Uncharacterized protein n=1 Tax=Saccharopolyspora dendranthemae TaxID=1181886 RepID=A0A561U2X4_9PSEU|nr:hypothetical protein FHU35_15565 [Saccharopolyspora dendranthemae]